VRLSPGVVVIVPWAKPPPPPAPLEREVLFELPLPPPPPQAFTVMLVTPAGTVHELEPAVENVYVFVPDTAAEFEAASLTVLLLAT
jgi:hypothetical protein